MKINEKPKPKKGKVKKKDGVSKAKPKKEKVLVVAQEIKYARLLCSNEKKTRDKVLKALKKWLSACFEKNYEFKEEDFMRVWKGLFYAVWMSDKPLIQEELCDNISSILDMFPPEQVSAAMLMAKAGFKTLAMEWYGIDHHRMDKFLMLVRRYLRGSLRVLYRCGWSIASCEHFAQMLGNTDGILAVKTPHYARNALSMIMHVMDCYLEEIAKVSGGNIEGVALATLLHPIISTMCLAPPALAVAARRVLTALLRQSDTELKMNDKIRAWEKMGCPEGGPDALETDDEDEDDEERHDDENITDDDSAPRPLDPRAGRVDVELPLLPVPAALLASTLREMLTKVGSKAYRRVNIVAQRFERLAKGEPAFPPPVAPPTTGGTKRKGTIKKMIQFEQKIAEDADELRLRGLSRKHRKRLLKKTRAGLSIVEDVEQINAQTKKQSSGEWKIEPLHDEAKDTSDKENEVKNKTETGKTTKKRKTEQDSPVAAKKQKHDVKTNKKQKINKRDKNKQKNTLTTELNNKETNKKQDTKEILQNGVTKKRKHSVVNLKENKTNKKQENQTKTKLDSQKETLENGITENKTKTKTDSEKETLQIGSTENKTTTKTNSLQKETLQNGSLENKTKTKTDSEKETLQNGVTENKMKTKTDSQNGTLVNKTKTQTEKLNRAVISYTFDINNVKNPKNTNTKSPKTVKPVYGTPKKVKFVLKNNSMQKPIDYYKSVRQSPNIPFDSSKKPVKTNLKPCTPSPINPFFKKKLKMKK